MTGDHGFFVNANQLEKITKKTHQPNQNDQHNTDDWIMPMFKAKVLLDSPDYRSILEQIAALSYEISDHHEDYPNLYEPLIENYAYFVQYLTDDFSKVQHGSMLSIGLQRGLAVMEKLASRPQIDPLFLYLGFSAVLLRDLGSIKQNRDILITDNQGAFIAHWNPMHGSMPTTSYYRIEPIVQRPLELSNLQSATMATLCMPHVGMTWLQTDDHLYAFWLAYLMQDKDHWGEIGAELERIVDHTMIKNIKENDKVYAQKIKANAYALAFQAWLRKKIKDKKITVNQKNSLIHTKGKYVKISGKVLKSFLTDYKKKAPYTISYRKIFNELGIPSWGEMDRSFAGLYGKPGKFQFGIFGKSSKTVKSGSKEKSVITSKKLLGPKAPKNSSKAKSFNKPKLSGKQAKQLTGIKSSTSKTPTKAKSSAE